MLKKVLIRFRARFQNGEYDNFEQLAPLLTPDEAEYIEEQIHLEEAEQQHRWEKERKERLKKAAPLIKKFPDKECLFGSYYGEKELVCTYDGTIDFDPEGYKSVVGADRFTYDEYLEVQIKSFHKTRDCFVGKEDHVWMDISGFEGFQVGDCLSFFAEIHRYVKTGNGKQIDCEVFCALFAQKPETARAGHHVALNGEAVKSNDEGAEKN